MKIISEKIFVASWVKLVGYILMSKVENIGRVPGEPIIYVMVNLFL